MRTNARAPLPPPPRPQAAGLVTARQLEDWGAEVAASFEREWAAAQAGAYRESAKEFLSSSWQGDALAVRRARARGPRPARTRGAHVPGERAPRAAVL